MDKLGKILILTLLAFCAFLIIIVMSLAPAHGSVTLTAGNFGYSTIASPGVANDATQLAVTATQGARFPGGQFRAILFDAACSSAAFCNNREIVTIQAVTPGSDTFDIIARAVESTTTPDLWPAGSKIFHTITAGTYDAMKTAINDHLLDVANPHVVTKAQVGLTSVEDTALSTWVGSTSITTLSIITTGTWNADDIALGTYTSGNYVSSATANKGLTLTGTEGATLGIMNCAEDEGIKYSGGSWICAAFAAGTVIGTDTLWNVKGDLAAGTGSDTAARVAVGANYSFLIADSLQSVGMRWFTMGAALQALRVNAAGTAIEWATIAGGGDVLGPATHSASYIPKWNSVANSKTLVAGVAAPSGAIVGDTDTQTLMGKTINAESTGNVITLPVKFWLAGAGCNDTVASPFWDLKAVSEGAAIPACVKITGSGPVLGVLDFADGTTSPTAQTNFMLPSDFSSSLALDLHFKWFSPATSGYVVWAATIACVADGAANDAVSFPAVTTVVDLTKTTANATNDAPMLAVPKSGCGANSLLHLRIRRDPNNVLDTMAGTARLVGVEVTYRRQM